MQSATATTYRLRGKEPHILSLTLLSAFAAMSAILMTPALPAIAFLLLPMGLLCIGHAILVSTALSLAITQTEDRANGSAVINSLNMSMPVLMTLLLGVLHVSAAWVMPFIFLIALGLMLSVYIVLLGRT